MRQAIIFVIITLIIISCKKIPADPGNSFSEAIKDGLHVGYSLNSPWVKLNSDSVSGFEAELIKDFAQSFNIKILWESGSEGVMLEKLEKKQLHIVIAGLKNDTPWKSKKIGLTKPFYWKGKEKHVIAVQQGENRLLFNLEKYLFSRKEEIKQQINATDEDF